MAGITPETVEQAKPALNEIRDWVNQNRETLNALIPQTLSPEQIAKLTIPELAESDASVSSHALFAAIESAGAILEAQPTHALAAEYVQIIPKIEPVAPLMSAYETIYLIAPDAKNISDDPQQVINQSALAHMKHSLKLLLEEDGTAQYAADVPRFEVTADNLLDMNDPAFLATVEAIETKTNALLLARVPAEQGDAFLDAVGDAFDTGNEAAYQQLLTANNFTPDEMAFFANGYSMILTRHLLGVELPSERLPAPPRILTQQETPSTTAPQTGAPIVTPSGDPVIVVPDTPAILRSRLTSSYMAYVGAAELALGTPANGVYEPRDARKVTQFIQDQFSPWYNEHKNQDGYLEVTAQTAGVDANGAQTTSDQTFLIDEKGNIFSATNENGKLKPSAKNVGSIRENMPPHLATAALLDDIWRAKQEPYLKNLNDETIDEERALDILNEQKSHLRNAFPAITDDQIDEVLGELRKADAGKQAHLAALKKYQQDGKPDDAALDSLYLSLILLVDENNRLSLNDSDIGEQVSGLEIIRDLLGYLSGAGSAELTAQHTFVSNIDIQDSVLPKPVYNLLSKIGEGTCIPINLLYAGDNDPRKAAVEQYFNGKTITDSQGRIVVSREQVYGYVREVINTRALERLGSLDKFSQALITGEYVPFDKDVDIVFKAFGRPDINDPTLQSMLDQHLGHGESASGNWFNKYTSEQEQIDLLSKLSGDEVLALGDRVSRLLLADRNTGARGWEGEGNRMRRETAALEWDREKIATQWSHTPQAVRDEIMDVVLKNINPEIRDMRVFQETTVSYLESRMGMYMYKRAPEWNDMYGDLTNAQKAHLYMQMNVSDLQDNLSPEGYAIVMNMNDADPSKHGSLDFNEFKNMSDQQIDNYLNALPPQDKKYILDGVESMNNPNMYVYLMRLNRRFYIDGRNDYYAQLQYEQAEILEGQRQAAEEAARLQQQQQQQQQTPPDGVVPGTEGETPAGTDTNGTTDEPYTDTYDDAAPTFFPYELSDEFQSHGAPLVEGAANVTTGTALARKALQARATKREQAMADAAAEAAEEAARAAQRTDDMADMAKAANAGNLLNPPAKAAETTAQNALAKLSTADEAAKTAKLEGELASKFSSAGGKGKLLGSTSANALQAGETASSTSKAFSAASEAAEKLKAVEAAEEVAEGAAKSKNIFLKVGKLGLNAAKRLIPGGSALFAGAKAAGEATKAFRGASRLGSIARGFAGFAKSSFVLAGLGAAVGGAVSVLETRSLDKRLDALEEIGLITTEQKEKIQEQYRTANITAAVDVTVFTSEALIGQAFDKMNLGKALDTIVRPSFLMDITKDKSLTLDEVGELYKTARKNNIDLFQEYLIQSYAEINEGEMPTQDQLNAVLYENIPPETINILDETTGETVTIRLEQAMMDPTYNAQLRELYKGSVAGTQLLDNIDALNTMLPQWVQVKPEGHTPTAAPAYNIS